LRQGTPFYSGYRLRPTLPAAELVAQFTGEPARFLAALLKHAKHGRSWLSFDPEALSSTLGQPRERIIRALEVLEERGYGVLEASDVRHRFTRTAATPEPLQLVTELTARFERREAKEIERIAQVLHLVHTPGCLSNALVAHFGEQRAVPCGHCSRCRGGGGPSQPSAVLSTAAALTTREREPVAVAPSADPAALRALSLSHPQALGEARQLARFLCGITSPAATRAKLSRHALFGALAERRFGEVMAVASRVLEA
jgi:ATP-dependent DNA helicase RecQ